jgi:aminoglycoside 2''-phosphotransferase
MRTADEAAELIRRYLPQIEAKQVKELPHTAWGGDSDAFVVDGTHVFRFPRTPAVARALEVEICLLPQLAPRVELSIPQFEYVARDAGTPLFAGYRCIPGEPLTPDVFAELARDLEIVDGLARQMGAFLTALHTCPLGVARACGVPEPDRPRRVVIQRLYARQRQIVYPALDEISRQYLDGVFTSFLGDERPFSWPETLCHGDLSADHILLDDGLAIAGIIDFGDLCIGDPAGDCVWALEYGEEFLRRVLGHYQGPIEDKEAFARVVALRAALLPTTEIAYGLETNNQEYVEEGRAALRVQSQRLSSEQQR